MSVFQKFSFLIYAICAGDFLRFYGQWRWLFIRYFSSNYLSFGESWKTKANREGSQKRQKSRKELKGLKKKIEWIGKRSQQKANCEKKSNKRNRDQIKNGNEKTTKHMRNRYWWKSVLCKDILFVNISRKYLNISLDNIGNILIYPGAITLLLY